MIRGVEKSILQVSLDGGLTFIDAPQGVRVVHPKIEHPDIEGITDQLIVNHTHEGIIMDVWENTEPDVLTYENVGTSSQMLAEIIAGIVG
jgi:hypothetical protein